MINPEILLGIILWISMAIYFPYWLTLTILAAALIYEVERAHNK